MNHLCDLLTHFSFNFCRSFIYTQNKLQRSRRCGLRFCAIEQQGKATLRFHAIQAKGIQAHGKKRQCNCKSIFLKHLELNYISKLNSNLQRMFISFFFFVSFQTLQELHILSGNFTLHCEDQDIEVSGATEISIPTGARYGLTNRSDCVGIVEFTYAS